MKRVVGTGYGMITRLGRSARETWEALIAGRSGVGPISLFDSTGYPVQIAAEVKGFDPARAVDPKSARRMDRFEQLANAAAREAISASGLEITDANRHRIGLTLSSAFGGLTSMVEEITMLNAEGPRAVDPFGLTKFMTTSPSISIAYGIRGPAYSVASACAPGADGIGLALHLLRAGAADAIIAG